VRPSAQLEFVSLHSRRLKGCLAQDGNFGGCFLVEGGGQGATLRDLTVGGCGMGAISVQGASNVRLTGLNIEEKNGPALVARKGSAVTVSGAEINQLPPPPERFLYSWSLLCSDMTEAECAVLRPVPAFNETLCHKSSMVQDEHDEEEHEEEEHGEDIKFRMCPGTTKDMCIMQGELTSSSLGEIFSGHQHDQHDKGKMIRISPSHAVTSQHALDSPIAHPGSCWLSSHNSCPHSPLQVQVKEARVKTFAHPWIYFALQRGLARSIHVRQSP
jgi:hypothetical protein